MTLAIFLDEHVDPLVAVLARQGGLDILTTQEAGRANQRLSDEDQLQFAADNQRAILTYNAVDFDRIARRWGQEGREHYGIIVSRPKEPWEIAASLARLVELYRAAGVRNLYLRLQ